MTTFCFGVYIVNESMGKGYVGSGSCSTGFFKADQMVNIILFYQEAVSPSEGRSAVQECIRSASF